MVTVCLVHAPCFWSTQRSWQPFYGYWHPLSCIWMPKSIRRPILSSRQLLQRRNLSKQQRVHFELHWKISMWQIVVRMKLNVSALLPVWSVNHIRMCPSLLYLALSTWSLHQYMSSHSNSIAIFSRGSNVWRIDWSSQGLMVMQRQCNCFGHVKTIWVESSIILFPSSPSMMLLTRKLKPRWNSLMGNTFLITKQCLLYLPRLVWRGRVAFSQMLVSRRKETRSRKRKRKYPLHLTPTYLHIFQQVKNLHVHLHRL